MTITTRKLLPLLAFATALLASVPAKAALIDYDFAVTIDTLGASLHGQSFAGSFSFDDSQVPFPGFDGEDLYALQTFSFDFAGTVYTLDDLFYGDAAVLDGSLLGLEALATTFSFLPASPFLPGLFPATFAYDFGTGDAGFGSLVFTPATGTAVPEPAMTWLLASGLFIATATRRRRKLGSDPI